MSEWDVPSFGQTAEEAITNLKEAVELHFEDNASSDYQAVDRVISRDALVDG